MLNEFKVIIYKVIIYSFRPLMICRWTTQQEDLVEALFFVKILYGGMSVSLFHKFYAW